MKNWKTTLTGILALLTSGWAIYQKGGVPDGTDIAAIIAGAGLIAAKDHNVTGGTVRQQ